MDGAEGVNQTNDLRKSHLSGFRFPNERPNVPADEHGWFDDASVKAFDSVCGPHVKLYLELGCWIGKSMRYVLDRCPNANAIGIDTWHVKNPHLNQYIKDLPFTGRLFETFVVNMWEYRDRITPIRMLTRDGIELLREIGQHVDIVYIDAGHDYKNVATDVRNVARFCPNATIVMDDNDPHEWPGVAKVVDRFNEIAGRPYRCDDPTARVPVFHPLKTAPPIEKPHVVQPKRPNSEQPIYIITPMSRPENAPVLLEAMEHTFGCFDWRWVVVLDGPMIDLHCSHERMIVEAYPNAPKPKKACANYGLFHSGNPLRNRGLELTPDDAVVGFADDDQVPMWGARVCLEQFFADGRHEGFVGDICHPNGRVYHRWNPRRPLRAINTAQYWVRRRFIGETRWLEDVRFHSGHWYCADQYFFRKLYKKNPAAWVHYPTFVAAYNSLRGEAGEQWRQGYIHRHTPTMSRREMQQRRQQEQRTETATR